MPQGLGVLAQAEVGRAHGRRVAHEKVHLLTRRALRPEPLKASLAVVQHLHPVLAVRGEDLLVPLPRARVKGVPHQHGLRSGVLRQSSRHRGVPAVRAAVEDAHVARSRNAGPRHGTRGRALGGQGITVHPDERLDARDVRVQLAHRGRHRHRVAGGRGLCR